MKIFKHILDDVFAGLPDPPVVHQIPSARTRGFDVELVLKQKCIDKGLMSHEPWIERCKQLYNISKVHHGKTCNIQANCEQVWYSCLIFSSCSADN